MRLALAALALVLASPARAAEPLQVSAQKRPIGEGGDMWDVILTSRQDRLDVVHIDLNRGNCHARMDGTYRNPYGFGQQIAMRMFDCDPIEVHVVAKQGETTITLPE